MSHKDPHSPFLRANLKHIPISSLKLFPFDTLRPKMTQILLSCSTSRPSKPSRAIQAFQRHPSLPETSKPSRDIQAFQRHPGLPETSRPSRDIQAFHRHRITASTKHLPANRMSIDVSRCIWMYFVDPDVPGCIWMYFVDLEGLVIPLGVDTLLNNNYIN